MAGEWPETTLAGVSSDVSYGYTESATLERVGPRFLRITDIQNGVVDWSGVPFCPISRDDHSKYRLQDGDIVVARTGNSTGENYLFRGNEDAVFASYLIRFRIDGSTADPAFVWYHLRSAAWRRFINGAKTGSAQAGANARVLGTFSFTLPPLPEQKRIAHILGTLDDKIELNRRMNATLEAMSRAIFKSWFVDFDPVRQKAAGKQPVGMDAQTAALFPDSFEDSEIGEVPKGWEVQPIGDLASADKGLSYKGSGLVDEGGVPMVNLGCFQGAGRFAAENIKGYAGDYASRHVVSGGDLVVANTDMTQKRLILGSPAIVPGGANVQSVLFTHHVFALRFTPEASHLRRYVYFCLLRPDFRTVAEGYATGTTVLALPKEAILNYRICRPSEDVLDRFMSLLTPITSLGEVGEQQSSRLAALRDTLLPKLLSGEVRVPEAEGVVEEVCR